MKIVLLFTVFIFNSCFKVDTVDRKTEERTYKKEEKSVVSKPKVVVTTSIIYDTVLNIAGGAVELTAIMPPGVDPHIYTPTKSDLLSIARADLVIYNGLYLEGKMSEVFLKLEERGRNVVSIASFIDKSNFIEPKNFPGQYDPHIWMDPNIWLLSFEGIANKLGELVESKRAFFIESANNYRRKVEALSEEVEKKISTIPEKQRVLITSHDAFEYYGRRFGIETIGIQGISTVTEAGVGDIKRIVNIIIERNLKAIFFETTVPKRYVVSVIERVGAMGHSLKIGGELLSDSLAPKGKQGDTYIGMIRYNTDTIVNALK